MTKGVFSALLGLMVSHAVVAQIQTISFTDNFTFTCGSSLVVSDDNGDGAGSVNQDTQLPYSCEDFTVTICPDQPGQGIMAEFIAFELQNNINPNNADFIYVYDADVADPAFQVGSSSGTGYNGTIFVASTNNPTGCLTFEFVCNSGNTSGAQGFVFELSCVQPCATPVASVELASLASFPDNPQPFPGNPQSVGMCPDDLVTFDATASSAGTGFDLENITWNWGDGNAEELPYATGAVASHQYDTPGEYLVTAVVEDNNGCPSVNLEPFQLLVSTLPIFNTTIDSPICTDVVGYGNGNPVQSVVWTALPPVGQSESEPIPDQTGVPFSSTLTVDFFDAGQTLENCEDLISLTANIEHSYLADVTMSVECPNGTQVILMENEPNGGLGTSGCIDANSGGWYLGEPDDLDGIEPNPGVGYDYTWSMDGEWVINDAANPNVTGAPITVNPGVYLPCGDLCDLEGCPLNGNWQFIVLDQYGGDNGFVFEWQLEFDPGILPDITTFEPVIGLESDSSFWDVAGFPEIISTSDNGNTIEYSFDVAGTYYYDFEVTNNFGCRQDTTVEIEVIDNPGTDLTVGDNQIWCNATTPVELEASLGEVSVTPSCAADAGSFNYCYQNDDLITYTYCPDVIGDGTAMQIEFVQGFLESGFDEIFVYDGEDDTAPLLATLTGDVSGESFEACSGGGCITFVLDADFTQSCADNGYDELQWNVSCAAQGDQCGYDWSWTPATDLSNADSPNPTLNAFSGVETEFLVSVGPSGLDNCAATGTVTVSPAFMFEANKQDPTCQITDGVIEVDLLTAFGDGQGPFTAEILKEDPVTGNFSQVASTTWVDNSTFGKYDLEPGIYSVVVENDEGCFYVQNFDLAPPPPLTLEVPPVQTICLGASAVMEVESPQDINFSFTYVWDNGLPNGPVQQVSPNVSTVYAVQGFDQAGCPTPVYNVGVNVLDALSADLTTATDFLCSGQEADLDASASNGGSGSGYTYLWSFEGNPLNEDDAQITTIPPSSGTYCVTVDDDCETPPSQACAEVVLETPVPIAFSADTTEACNTGDFYFTNETESSLFVASTWAFGDNTFSGETNTPKTFSAPGFYDVALTVTSLAGGCDYTLVKEAYINVYPIPDVGYLPSPQPTRAPDTEITFAGQSEANVVEWHWTFNSIDPLGESFEQNPTFQFPAGQGGEYPVKLEVTDANGCTNEVTRLIEIKDMFNLFIPNSFTPNNDGYNDAFFVQGTDIDPNDFKLEIWNRWGTLVWSTTDPSDAWYGQVDEEGQHYVPNGTYPYRVEVHSLEDDGLSKEVFGIVTIVR